MAKKILLLHETGEAPDGLAELAGEMRALGAEVVIRACAEPYGNVLDAVEAADSIVFWG
jgi:hypothetical protein